MSGKIKFKDKRHEMFRAHQVVSKAKRDGKLSYPEILKCFDCPKKAAEYDHPRGYGLEHQLDVEPVCCSCHRLREFSRGIIVTGGLLGQLNGNWKGGISGLNRKQMEDRGLFKRLALSRKYEREAKRKSRKEKRLTESKFTANLLVILRKKMPGSVVWKLSDRFTRGIPDAVIVLKGVSTWFEFKSKTYEVTPIQKELLRRVKRGYTVRAIDKGVYHIEQPSVPGSKVEIRGYELLIDHLIGLCKL